MIGLGRDENVQRPQLAQNKTYLVDPEDSAGDACSEGGGQVGQTLFQLCFHLHAINLHASPIYFCFLSLCLFSMRFLFYLMLFIFFWGEFQGGCDLSWCSYTPKLTEFQVTQPFYHDSFGPINVQQFPIPKRPTL